MTALLVASVAVDATTSAAQAQNQLAPIAIASLEVTTEATDTTPAVVTLDGSDSFDPDGSIVRYRWEVITEAYSWLELNQASPQSPVATFEVPVQKLIERFGWSIEFRLTVTDSGRPAAIDSDVVKLRINQPPVANIEVTAKLFDLDDEAGYDDNRNGVVDENEERYTIEGVISRPGEGGNAPDEWTIRGGSLLVLDASGSFDPDGDLAETSISWERLRFRGAASVASSLPGDTVGQSILSTDEDPHLAASVRSETVARPPFVSGVGTEPFLVYYRLTVTDAHGAIARETVKIAIVGIETPNGPDFCANRSLGGPQTYPFDSSGDGVADTCSLRDTRRATVARQNALEALAARNPAVFRAAVLAQCADEEFAQADYGDDPADLAIDVCQSKQVSPPPPPADPATAAAFFSGVIDGPHYCTNRSLGGPRTYPFDRPPRDGVADTCSLPYTRREAIARQRALEAAFAGHPQFETTLASACSGLGTLDFADDPDDLAADACHPPTAPPELGSPLPTPSV